MWCAGGKKCINVVHSQLLHHSPSVLVFQFIIAVVCIIMLRGGQNSWSPGQLWRTTMSSLVLSPVCFLTIEAQLAKIILYYIINIFLKALNIGEVSVGLKCEIGPGGEFWSSEMRPKRK